MSFVNGINATFVTFLVSPSRHDLPFRHYLSIAGFFGLGRNPEFVDPRVVASGEGRDVIRVSSRGSVQVEFHIITKDLKRLGYDSAPRHAAHGPGIDTSPSCS